MDSPEKRSDGIHSAQIDRASLKCLIDAAGDRNTLARRCGWMNLDKGRRRLQALVDGDLRHYEDFREALARGLGISAAQLDAVVDAQRHREARRAARDFVPHVVWRTAQSRPSGITLAVAFGFVSRLRFDPVDRTPLAMLREAVARCPGELPFFGRVTGFVINYRPDLAIHFDRRGHPLRELHRPAGIGLAGGIAARMRGVLASE